MRSKLQNSSRRFSNLPPPLHLACHCPGLRFVPSPLDCRQVHLLLCIQNHIFKIKFDHTTSEALNGPPSHQDVSLSPWSCSQGSLQGPKTHSLSREPCLPVHSNVWSKPGHGREDSNPEWGSTSPPSPHTWHRLFPPPSLSEGLRNEGPCAEGK